MFEVFFVLIVQIQADIKTHFGNRGTLITNFSVVKKKKTFEVKPIQWIDNFTFPSQMLEKTYSMGFSQPFSYGFGWDKYIVTVEILQK